MIISQILVIAYWLAKIFINAINHGKPARTFDNKPLTYNAFGTIFRIVTYALVLYYGGFWDCLLGKL